MSRPRTYSALAAAKRAPLPDPKSDESIARTVAVIVGASSGAALAIAELDRLRAEGVDAAIWCQDRNWIVGPRVMAGTAGDGEQAR